jgi:hypothetical protein
LAQTKSLDGTKFVIMSSSECFTETSFLTKLTELSGGGPKTSFFATFFGRKFIN